MIHNEALSFSEDDKLVRKGIGIMNTQTTKEHDMTDNIETLGMDTVTQDMENILQQQREDSPEETSESTEGNDEVQNETTAGTYPRDLNPFRGMTNDELMETRERLLCEENVIDTDLQMTQVGDNDLQLDTPSAYRMAPQTNDKETSTDKGENLSSRGESKEDLRIELQGIQEETVKLILKLNSRPFPIKVMQMMGTFLDKAVEDESIAIYMSVMHEGTGDKDVTLAFEGSLTKGKGLENIFPDQIRTWEDSSPMTIRATRRKTDRGEPVYEVKDIPRIVITLADEIEALLTDIPDKRDPAQPETLQKEELDQKEVTSMVKGAEIGTAVDNGEEGITTEPVPEERVDTLTRKKSITKTQERTPRDDTRPKEGWKSQSETIFVLDVLPWCVLGTEGVACTMGKLVHSLVIQSRRKVTGWLCRQLARPVRELTRDQGVFTDNIMDKKDIFMDTPWRNYPAHHLTSITSPWDLSLNHWISLVAIHGAARVNSGPGALAMHMHLVVYPRWKWCAYLLPERVITSFSMTTEQVQMARSRYATVQHIPMKPIQAARRIQQNGSLWLTKATHLSPPLIMAMMDNFNMDPAYFHQGCLPEDKTRICQVDPSIFDVPAYACGREFTPRSKYLLEQDPCPTPKTYMVPWSWEAPFDNPAYYALNKLNSIAGSHHRIVNLRKLRT